MTVTKVDRDVWCAAIMRDFPTIPRTRITLPIQWEVCPPREGHQCGDGGLPGGGIDHTCVVGLLGTTVLPLAGYVEKRERSIIFSNGGTGVCFNCFNLRGSQKPLTFLVAQMVKHLPTMQETWVQTLGLEDLLKKKMAAHSRILAWKIPWTEEPGRLQSVGSQRVGHDWATSLAGRLNEIKHKLLSTVIVTAISSITFIITTSATTATAFTVVIYKALWQTI